MTDLAKQMWEAYAKQAGGVTFDGNPLHDWDGLGEDRQSCWVAAARVAADRIEQLEAALRMAAGYISTKEGHTDQHPQDVYDWIVRAALEGE